ncbi:MAG: lytic transglycosylase domain-containing protein [Candidatus Gracilibacteria bacterium]|nr:lytic transglycosylase domain-containing protein [Candidatus Gracilibacteria bacterium]
MKKKHIIWSRIGLLIFIIFIIIFKYNFNNKSIFFSYPGTKIEFAGEKVPMDSNYFFNQERFDKEFFITSYNIYQVILYIKRSPLYMPYIEKKLKENDIPDDFKYLAIAESALLNNALSTATAAGIWQFMPDTAKRFGLRVDDKVDERYNAEKEADAAIKYFKVLYKDLKDWTLVARAYNRGENGIKNAMEKQKVSNFYDLYLNDETSRYVFRILAIKYVMQDYESKKWVIDKLIGDKYYPSETKTIKINKIDDLYDFASKNNTNYKNIKLLNPWIIGDSLPEGKWEIKINK